MFKRLGDTIKKSHILMSVIRWIDADAYREEVKMLKGGKVDWFRVMPLIGVHLMCLGPIIWGWSWVAVIPP